MDSSLKTILSQVYELEGLLLLVDNHGKETSALVYELIREKSVRIAELSAGLRLETEHSADDAECRAGCSGSEELQDYVPNLDAAVDPMAFVQLGADTNSDDEQECDNENIPSEESVANDESVSTIDFEPGFTPDFEPDSDELQLPDEEFYDDDEEDIDFDRVEDIADDEDSDNEEFSPEDADEEGKPMPVFNDVAGAKGDFRKLLTLNDKFRFRRELFRNSETLFADALNVIDTMESFAEAEEYFYNVLEWDRESEEVIDFMNLIKIHFEK